MNRGNAYGDCITFKVSTTLDETHYEIVEITRERLNNELKAPQPPPTSGYGLPTV